MLLSKEVEVTWQRRNIGHYKSKGYVYTELGDAFLVKPSDLSEGSHVKVVVQCDYCGIEQNKPYKSYLLQAMDGLGMDSCVKCKTHKSTITLIDKYGTDNPMKVDTFKNKQRESLMDNYGVTSPLQSNIIMEKTRKTNLEKYGVDIYAKSDECQEKMKQTNLERYGVEHYSMTDEYKIKVVDTNRARYGVDSVSQIPDVKSKKNKTMYANGTTMTSKQQIYLHNLIGGELNYPVSRSALDIALVNEKIYIEYDGGGHNLKVKLGHITTDEFNKKEKKRTFSLFDQGWKEIRFVSDKDKLPSDFEILSTVEKSKSFLIEGITKSVIVNWDDRTVLFGFKKKVSLDEFLLDNFEFYWEVS